MKRKHDCLFTNASLFQAVANIVCAQPHLQRLLGVQTGEGPMTKWFLDSGDEKRTRVGEVFVFSWLSQREPWNNRRPHLGQFNCIRRMCSFHEVDLREQRIQAQTQQQCCVR